MQKPKLEAKPNALQSPCHQRLGSIVTNVPSAITHLAVGAIWLPRRRYVERYVSITEKVRDQVGNTIMLAPEKQDSNATRQQMFVAPKAQGKLLLRVLVYCVVSAVVTSVLHTAVGYFQLKISGVVWLCGPIALALLATIPWVLYDATKVSNRLFGPMARVQGAIRRLANRDPVGPIELRDDDAWHSWIQDFNGMTARVQNRPEEQPAEEVV